MRGAGSVERAGECAAAVTRKRLFIKRNPQRTTDQDGARVGRYEQWQEMCVVRIIIMFYIDVVSRGSLIVLF